MMRSTLGAPLGGTTRGGHQGVESLTVSLITPPNGGAGAGSCFPLTVVVASADPNWPVTCWAAAEMKPSEVAQRNTPTFLKNGIPCDAQFMIWLLAAKVEMSLSDALRRDTGAQYAAALIGVVDRNDGLGRQAIGKSYNGKSNRDKRADISSRV